MNVEVTHQARDNLSTGVPHSGVSRRGRKQELSGFLATHPVPLPYSTTPAEPTRPHLLAVLPVLPSGPVDRRPQRVLNLEAFHTALASAAYASRAALPPPMQGSLPAGGLRLCREGVEPSGSLRKVSDLHALLLSRTYPDASWAHARPNLFELADIASKARKGKPTTISPIAFEAVRKMDAIFMLERSINGLSPEERLAARRRDIAPLVDDLIDWMKQ